MNVPEKYQVFKNVVSIPDKDIERLSPYLSGWVHLHSLLVRGINEPDTEKLIVLELLGGRRREIIRRLLVRLSRIKRADIQAKIEPLIK